MNGSPNARLTVAFLLAQTGDLLTFLLAMRVVDASREIGPIGMVYATYGSLGAIAYKAIPACVVAWVCVHSTHPHAARVILWVGVVLGVAGILLNTLAWEALRV